MLQAGCLGGGSFLLPVAFLLLLDIVKKICESFRVRDEGVWIPDQMRVDGLESPNAAFCQEAQHLLVKPKWAYRGDAQARKDGWNRWDGTQIIQWEHGAAVWWCWIRWY
jgi:hypothetical protein